MPQANSGAPESSGRGTRIVIWMVVLLFVLLTMWQNWGDIDTKVLFFTITMPRIAFSGGMLLVGLLLGLTASFVFRNRKNR